MDEKIVKFKELMSQDEICAKVQTLQDVPAILKLLADNGLVLTADELGQISKSIVDAHENGELSENDLEDVAGGHWIGKLIEGVYYVYKICSLFW